MTLPGSPRTRVPLLGGAAAAGALVTLACALPRPVAQQPAAVLQLTSVPAAGAAAAARPAAPDAPAQVTVPGTTPTRSSARPAAPSRAWAPTDRLLTLSFVAAWDTTRPTAPRDSARPRPTNFADTVVLPNTAAAKRHFDSVGTAMMLMRAARGDTIGRDSVRASRRRRFHVSAAGRDSVVIETTPVDSSGRPLGRTERRVLPADPWRTQTSDSVLVLVDGREVGRGLRSLGEFSTDSVVSINVVKGERAVETYGERGRRGVVEINTKRAAHARPSPR